MGRYIGTIGDYPIFKRTDKIDKTWSMGRKMGTIGDFPTLPPESPRIVSLSKTFVMMYMCDDV